MKENHIQSPNLNIAFCQTIIQLRKSYATTVLTVLVLVGPTLAPAWVFFELYWDDKFWLTYWTGETQQI